jgi:hypothetical protein
MPRTVFHMTLRFADYQLIGPASTPGKRHNVTVSGQALRKFFPRGSAPLSE